MNIRKIIWRFLALTVISSIFYTGYLNISAKTAEQSSNLDVTNKLETLGQPFNYPNDVYAQNVWDMQLYNERIYLGHGDYDYNTGPTPITYYDPSSEKFVKQYSVNEEQINTYKVLDGKLYVPGLDPIDDWSKGNFYRMENDTWQKYRNLPNVIHTFDMAYYNNNLYAATGSCIGNKYPAQILESSDKGETWKNILESGLNFTENKAERMYTLFQFNNKLYGVNALSPKSNSAYNNMICIDNNGVSNIKVRGDLLLPGVDSNSDYLYTIFQPTVINNKLIYIVTSESIGTDPEGLFIASDLNSATKIALPEANALPIDILVRGDSTYILAYIKTASNDYINIVYESGDLNNWTELFRFNAETSVRSFEKLGDDFYFGLGWESGNKKASTGKILRLEKNSNIILPQPGNYGTMSLSNITTNSVDLNWKAATSQSNLQYKVVYSTTNNIYSVSSAENNGTTTQDWTASLTSTHITGLKENTRYYFNVLVKDSEDNKNIYTTVSNVLIVYYNENKGTGGGLPTDKNCYVPNAKVIVQGNTQSLVRTGYTFLGWNTKVDGTGSSYTLGSTFNMSTDDVILYANWMEK